MDCVEIEPTKTVLVLGPSFTAALLTDYDREQLTLTSTQLLEIGISLLWNESECHSPAEKDKFFNLYRNAYELDPLFAVKKLSSSLQKANKFDAWLQRSFDTKFSLIKDAGCLEKLKFLQQQGVILAYTHYDDILSKLTQTSPITLSDRAGFDSWCRSKSTGILYVNGIFSQPKSVVFDSQDSLSPAHPHCSQASQLAVTLNNKHIICIGFDFEREDQLLTKFFETYTSSMPRSLQLSLTCKAIDLSCVHSLSVPGNNFSALLDKLKPLDLPSKDFWRQMELPPCKDNSLALSLLVSNKDNAIEISSLASNFPGVNFALMSTCTHNDFTLHTVSIRVEKPKKGQLLEQVLREDRDTLLSKGLLAVVFQCGTFLWIRQKPEFDTPSMDILSPLAPPQAAEPVIKTEPQTPHMLGELNFSRTPPKQIPRYTMHQVKARSKPYPIPRGSPGKQELTQFGAHNARMLLERRASLPVNAMASGHSPALERLASNLTPAHTHGLPSYAAIKQALLCDWYKRRQSVQADPKTLKVLLKTKLISEPPDMLMLRRYSDPGYISHPESFARRKELFIDENLTWAKTCGRVIDEKISKWKAAREEKQRRRLMQKNGAFTAHSLKYHLLNSLQSNGVGSNGAPMMPAGYPGLNSYLYPTQTILAPVSGAQTPVYSPFMAPYMNPYQTMVQVGQPTALFVPQTTGVQAQQKLVYLVPPTTAASNSVPLISVSTAGQQLGFNPPPMFARKKSDSGVIKEDDLMREQFKRRQSVPNNLSSLLVSPLKQLRPCSPPPSKKPRLSDEYNQSRQQLSSRQHHLLQVHRSQQRNGDSRSTSPQSLDQSSSYSPTASEGLRNGDYSEFSDECDLGESEAEKIVGGVVVSPDPQTRYGGPSPHTQLQLWQFLLELLLISANTHLIQWSSTKYEFQINKPHEVAKLWGKVTNIDSMDYHQLLKGLRYYSTKGILSQVSGKELTFRYNLNSIQNYIEERRSNIANQEELVIVE